VIPDPIGAAVRWLGAGGLVAYPTETVWGLAAASGSAAGMERLLAWKRRGPESPVAILVDGAAGAEALGCELGPTGRRLALAHWPGPLTLVVPCRRAFAAGIARADGAVGLRSSSHPLAAALARRAIREGVGPITATSLNRHGEPPARTRAEAERLCAGEEDPRLLQVDGAEAGGDATSTVVDLCGAQPEVLRWGAIPRDEVEPLLQGLAP
jgi:tRNA threonylcarbamoyl adenosine modification protein (Sua5/YciO/YrdC/YwlC family)